MIYAGRAAIAALTVIAALAIGGCETHKAGADDDSAKKTAPTPDITVNAKPVAKPVAKPIAKPPTKPPAKPPTAPAKTPTRTAPPVAPPTAKASAQCKKTVAHMMKFYKKVIADQIAKVPAEMQGQAKLQAAQQLMQLPKRLLLECVGWSDAAQKCVQRAKSFELMATKCGPLLKAGNQAAAQPGQPSQPTEPEGTGGPSCQKIAANASAILKNTAGYDDRQAELLQKNVIRACSQRRWSAEVKSCIYRASRQDQFDECLRIARIELDE